MRNWLSNNIAVLTGPQNTQNTLYGENADNPAEQKGGIETPKNVTIYLPDEIASRMEKFPEVNWSEVCRKAVADYVDTRSHADIGPILEKLKSERNEAYKQGQILFYQIASKMGLMDFEVWYPRVSAKILLGSHNSREDAEPLTAEYVEHEIVSKMEFLMRRFCENNKIAIPNNATDAFWEGALTAFMKVYEEIKRKR